MDCWAYIMYLEEPEKINATVPNSDFLKPFETLSFKKTTKYFVKDNRDKKGLKEYTKCKVIFLESTKEDVERKEKATSVGGKRRKSCPEKLMETDDSAPEKKKVKKSKVRNVKSENQQNQDKKIKQYASILNMKKSALFEVLSDSDGLVKRNQTDQETNDDVILSHNQMIDATKSVSVLSSSSTSLGIASKEENPKTANTGIDQSINAEEAVADDIRDVEKGINITTLDSKSSGKRNVDSKENNNNQCILIEEETNKENSEQLNDNTAKKNQPSKLDSIEVKGKYQPRSTGTKKKKTISGASQNKESQDKKNIVTKPLILPYFLERNNEVETE